MLYCRCSGGGLQFRSSPSSWKYPELCGENGRFSPPVVMFGKTGQPGEVAIAVEDITPRTQFLLHYSFTEATSSLAGQKMRGATKLEGKGEYKGSGCELYILITLYITTTTTIIL